MREKMGLPILLSILPIILIAWPHTTEALTTFGKTNPQNQNQNPPQPPTPVGKARECKTESDCAGIQNTTCMADPQNGRTRCLCGDYSAPVNGACNIKFKAIRAPCNEDTECVIGAECVQRNSTIPGKRCYCKEGYYEDNLECNGAPALTFSIYSTALLVASIVSVKFISL